MRHRKATSTLDRKSASRKSLLRHLMTSLVISERITTTSAKAKAVRPLIERLITTAKKQTLAGRRIVRKTLYTESAAKKLFETIAPRFKDRHGGYTRILKVGSRPGDGAEQVRLEFLS